LELSFLPGPLNASTIHDINVGPIPPLLAERINKLTFNLIWEGKPAKIKKKTIIAEGNMAD